MIVVWTGCEEPAGFGAKAGWLLFGDCQVPISVTRNINLQVGYRFSPEQSPVLHTLDTVSRAFELGMSKMKFR